MQESTSNETGRAGTLGGLVFVLGPVMVLLVFTTLMALVAGLLGYHTAETLPIAVASGAAALAASVMTVALLYQQVAARASTYQDLQASQSRVSGILESAMDAIITIDEEQKIVLYNRAAERVFQWPREQVLGQSLEMLLPQRYRGRHASFVGNFGRTGVTSRRMGDRTVLFALRADGAEFPIEASISQMMEREAKFYTVILRDVTERERALAELSHSREQLREFAAAASSVREQEKSRIARELHDELGQALTALKMDMNWMAEHLPADGARLAGRLQAMQGMLDGTVAATRRISSDLRPLMLDDLGLLPAIEWLVQNFTERTGIHCELNLVSPDLDLAEPYATAVFRILQESLTNVARHAQASLVDVTLGLRAATIHLAVQDDGRGFALGDPRRPNAFGLLGMRERAYLLDGEVRMESTPGGGTRVEVRIPLREHPGAAHPATTTEGA